jgi:hypothetical protein
MASLRCVPVLVALLLAGCPAPLPPPPHARTDAGAARVSIEPDAAADAAPAVLRLHVRWQEQAADPPDQVRLFGGELSSYHLGRIRDRALPATLVEREIPILAFDQGGELVVAPLRPLAPGETYSLAAPRAGLIAVVSITAAEDAVLMARHWPPADAGAGIEHAVYCADAATPLESAVVRLDPLGVPAELGPSAGNAAPLAGCVHLSALEPAPDGVLLLPPARALGFAFDPAPFAAGPLPEPIPAACTPEEIPLGPGCARVEDDRLFLRGPELPTFWIVQAPELTFSTAVGPGEQRVMRGLVPASAFELSFMVLDAAGRASRGQLAISTDLARARVVINEVLADALGPEPAQEWVELVNDGAEAVDLATVTLEDVGGKVALPAHRLEPGAFALLVNESFDEVSTWDVAPLAGTALLRLPSLGKSGLANSGEPLVLRSAEGAILSRFPPDPKPKPGVSVARVAPWAPDEPQSFVLHAGGASPGAPNEVTQ